jgi:hypothetical protein
MCEMMHCFYWKRNWWIWNFFVSSSTPHWQCNKQTPVEGALLCWSFNLLPIFQPRFVSFPYFRVLMLTLVGETCRRYETTSFLLGFSTGRATNRFLWRELCHGEVLYLLLFSSSCMAFLPTTVFHCWNWWHKFSHCLELLHPFLNSPLAEPQTDFCRESSATSKFDDCSCFQTRSDSSAYSNVSMLKLMRQIFIAYESAASPLACPTDRSTNKSLQRELCHIEVWCLLMFFLTRSGSSNCHSVFGLKLMRNFYSICN